MKDEKKKDWWKKRKGRKDDKTKGERRKTEKECSFNMTC